MRLHPWLSNAAIISYQVLESRYFAFPNSIEFWFIVERHDTKVFIRLIASKTAWDLDAIKCIEQYIVVKKFLGQTEEYTISKYAFLSLAFASNVVRVKSS